MKIYPAIDLKEGHCVRLYQGSFDRVTRYHADPVAMAQFFMNQGADFLHIIDLDGAKTGSLVNFKMIEKIKLATGVQIQTGGGIRSYEQIKQMQDIGVNRVLLGSVAILSPDLTKEWINEFGTDFICLALDIRMDELQNPLLATHGWIKSSSKSLWQLIDEYNAVNIKHVMCTDINRDGTLSEPNFGLYKECLQRFPAINFQASGGISTLAHLAKLKSIPVSSAIVGRALYENKITLADALC